MPARKIGAIEQHGHYYAQRHGKGQRAGNEEQRVACEEEQARRLRPGAPGGGIARQQSQRRGQRDGDEPQQKRRNRQAPTDHGFAGTTGAGRMTIVSAMIS